MEGHKRMAGALLCMALLVGMLLPADAAGSGTERGKLPARETVRDAGVTAESDGELERLLEDYQAYEERFAAIETVNDISVSRYDTIEEQNYPVVMESFGEEELTFLAAFDRDYHRLAVFLADASGRILYKTNRLETNYRDREQLRQPTKDLAAVAFVDVNADGLTDIVLLTRCVNETGEYAGKAYKVGDVLFQGDGTFYRDWRVSDKINRFDMNKSAGCIVSYVRDGNSAEFLYTASTLEELLEKGFSVIEELRYTRNFEKLGRLQVVPGVFHLSSFDFFMIYLVNEQGEIVWCLQPMGDYENLYSSRGIACKDVDGDGMKDLVVLGRYSRENADGTLQVESSCAIFYQRTGGFDRDREFGEYYRCTDEDNMEKLVQKIREYWGWQTEESGS